MISGDGSEWVHRKHRFKGHVCASVYSTVRQTPKPHGFREILIALFVEEVYKFPLGLR